MSERINVHLSQPVAEFVDRMVGEAGLYETPSEYVRNPIRRDMKRRGGQFVQDASWPGTETWRQAASLPHAGLDSSPSPAHLQHNRQRGIWRFRAALPAPLRHIATFSMRISHIDLRLYAERKN